MSRNIDPMQRVVAHGVNEYGGHTETLACGHVVLRKRDIAGYTNAVRRRCWRCARNVSARLAGKPLPYPATAAKPRSLPAGPAIRPSVPADPAPRDR